MAMFLWTTGSGYPWANSGRRQPSSIAPRCSDTPDPESRRIAPTPAGPPAAARPVGFFFWGSGASAILQLSRTASLLANQILPNPRHFFAGFNSLSGIKLRQFPPNYGPTGRSFFTLPDSPFSASSNGSMFGVILSINAFVKIMV
jgi:hypothetical protein